MKRPSQNLIERIEKIRNSRVLTYIVSDRSPPFHARIGMDVIRFFYEHLRQIGKTKKIDLFLFSQGGDTIVPWRLVNIVREFARSFTVLIPYKAHSAATLIALGADEIIIGPMGELSPIDPSVSTPFNPSDPDNSARRIEIGVEDVRGFINLARETVGITDQDNLVTMLEKLADSVHPLAIGAVYRSHALIRLLAAKLLSLHMVKPTDSQRIPKIVDDLAEKLYYHNYLISRKEAEELGLRIVMAPKKLEDLMWDLYLAYEKEMELGQIFDPLKHLEKRDEVTLEKPIALIESWGLLSSIGKKISIKKTRPPKEPSLGTQIAVQEQLIPWETSKVEKE